MALEGINQRHLEGIPTNSVHKTLNDYGPWYLVSL
jgi:hypothetical protein